MLCPTATRAVGDCSGHGLCNDDGTCTCAWFFGGEKRWVNLFACCSAISVERNSMVAHAAASRFLPGEDCSESFVRALKGGFEVWSGVWITAWLLVFAWAGANLYSSVKEAVSPSPTSLSPASSISSLASSSKAYPSVVAERTPSWNHLPLSRRLLRTITLRNLSLLTAALYTLCTALSWITS